MHDDQNERAMTMGCRHASAARAAARMRAPPGANVV
jgi:hypothetical protein